MWKKTCLSIECTFKMWNPKVIMFHSNQVWCRTIKWCRVTVFSTQIVCCAVIDIMIQINNESCCILPPIPLTTCNCMTKQLTSLINANIIWAEVYIWIHFIQEIQDGRGRLPCRPRDFSTLSQGTVDIWLNWRHWIWWTWDRGWNSGE